MLTLLTVAAVVFGLLALPVSPWTGIGLLGLAYALRRGCVRHEEGFMATLAGLAMLGAVAMTAEGLWLELIARP